MAEVREMRLVIPRMRRGPHDAIELARARHHDAQHHGEKIRVNEYDAR